MEQARHQGQVITASEANLCRTPQKACADKLKKTAWMLFIIAKGKLQILLILGE